MTSREAMIQNLKNLKGKPLKDKVIHIATYFWAPILVTALVVVMIVSLIVTNINRKDPVLSLYCLNSMAGSNPVQAYLDEFAAGQGVDLDEYEVRLWANSNTNGTDAEVSYANAEVFAAMVSARELDLTAAGIQIMLQLAYNENFWDLTQLLTPEQIEANKDNFLYIDMTFVEMLNDWSIFEEMPPYPDPLKPEDMETPVPVALLLPEDAEFTKLAYPHMQAGIAVVVTATQQEMALEFLELLLK